jgi:hypothetical protein
MPNAGNVDGFALALDTNGTFRWAKDLGGAFADTADGIAVSSTTVAVAGAYASSMTVNNKTITNSGIQQGYVVTFATDGSAGLVLTFTGTGTSSGENVAIDSAGSIVVSGTLNGTADFGGGSVTSSMIDAFFAKYSSTGTYQVAKVIGGPSNDSVGFMTVDGSGNIFLVGTFSGSVAFGGGSPLNTNTANMVVAKYSIAGAYQWAQPFGGTTAQVSPHAAAANAAGDVVVAGYFCGSLAFGANSLSSVGSCGTDQDMFAARLSGTDGSPISQARAGGSSFDEALAATQTADGKHYVAGAFQGFADFGNMGRTSAGGFDAVVLALAPL